jgi:predicted protein tyrosine phosphatase
MNILFVCSKNLSRSPTAEMIYKDRSDLKVKSAGTEPSAGLAQTVELTAKLINWSDLVFVMEEKHRRSILEKFPFGSSSHVTGLCLRLWVDLVCIQR